MGQGPVSDHDALTIMTANVGFIKDALQKLETAVTRIPENKGQISALKQQMAELREELADLRKELEDYKKQLQNRSNAKLIAIATVISTVVAAIIAIVVKFL